MLSNREAKLDNNLRRQMNKENTVKETKQMDSRPVVINPLRDQDFETVNQTNGIENGYFRRLTKHWDNVSLARVDSLCVHDDMKPNIN